MKEVERRAFWTRLVREWFFSLRVTSASLAARHDRTDEAGGDRDGQKSRARVMQRSVGIN